MKLSIYKRLLFWFLLVSIVPMIVVGYITYKNSEIALKSHILDGYSAVSERIDHILTSYIIEKQKNTTALAFTASIIEIIEHYGGGTHKSLQGSFTHEKSYEDIKHYLTDYRATLGYYDIILANINGDIILSTRKEHDLSYNLNEHIHMNMELGTVFQKSLASLKTEISDFKICPLSQKPSVFICTPVFKQNECIGAVISQLINEEIYAQVQDYIGLGTTGEIVLATKEDDEVVFVAPLRHDPDAAFNRRIPLGAPEVASIQEALAGKEGSGLSIDYRNKEILAVWRYLPLMRWGLVVKIDSEEAFASVYNLRNWALFIGSTVILMVTLLALGISRSISAPIKKLHKGAEAVGKGNLDHKIALDTNDEIGELSRTFDKMTDSLKVITASRDELDKEIAERKLIEEKLRKNETKYRILVENIPQKIFLKNRDSVYISCNQNYAEDLHIKADDIKGKTDFEFYPKELADKYRADDRDIMKSEIIKDIEEKYIQDGKDFWVHTIKVPVKDDKEKTVGILGVFWDITEQKRTQEEMKAALKEKEILLKEIHHRVKNNLQVISSMLNLQKESYKNESGHQIFKDSQSCIKVMALVHEKLYQSKDLTSIDCRGYTEALVHDLARSYGSDIGIPSIKLEIQNFALEIDYMIPCGLIINELVSNSLKYAFPALTRVIADKPEIRIRFSKNGTDEITLIVSDNGIGLPDNIDIRKTDSLGLRLVVMLAEQQLNGKVKIRRSHGTEFSIIFRGED